MNHLYEISVVTFPAYKATDVEASTRSLTGFKEIEKEKVWIKSQLSNLEEKI
ncbi:HK97 family phage prohead protease [Pseudomonas aeruginosa]|uniref:HK97 family phage prohead protease n=1 Tax=Pseudomonas aeruginosa TaxID=287 RepID=UPI003C6DD84C